MSTNKLFLYRMKLLILVISILSLTSCGGQLKSSMLFDDLSGSAETEIEVAPLPANSINVTEVADTVDSALTIITIPASKSYNPTVFVDGWMYFSRNSEFELPEFVKVTNGRGGNHLLLVNITRAISNNSLPVNLKCIYKGQESNTFSDYSSAAKPYKFDFCVSDTVSVSPGTRAAVKLSADNILDATQRVGNIIEVARADKINVQVNNGNHKQSSTVQYITTATEFVFSVK